LDELAARIASRCQKLGENAVQVIGDGSKRVSRIGIGTGCYCNLHEYLNLGCDCSVVCDDGSRHWQNIQKARDMNHPVIRVNHGTSEEPSMITLTQYLNDNFEGLHAEHLPNKPCFRLIAAKPEDTK
jgi:putative NIF3 family GTP cyclohydrolase 1 type 2